MSLSETLKSHMNAVRGITGIDGLMNMSMATNALNATSTGGLMFYEDIDLSASTYDQNLWYPVYSSKFSKQKLDKLSAYIPEINPAVMKWGMWENSKKANSEAANAMCNVEVLMNHYGYGYNKYALAYSLADQYNSVRDDKKPICFDQNPNNGGYIFWLRGGSTYNLEISQSGNKWTVVKDEVNVNNVVLKPQEYPGNLKISGDVTHFLSFENLISKLGGVIRSFLADVLPSRLEVAA